MDTTIKTDTINITNKKYIQETIDLFGEKVSGSAPSPSPITLFNVDHNNAKTLPEKKRQIFHSCTAKLPYISKRARPDIATTISFLCTRVTKANKSDWNKLLHILKYPQNTITMALILSATSLTIFKTWADASYAPHDDMRSHTGGCSSLGIGVFMSKSIKQKLNSKSSTEAELIGASDILPFILWSNHKIPFKSEYFLPG